MLFTIKETQKPLITAILLTMRDSAPRCDKSCFDMTGYINAEQYKTTNVAMLFVVEQLKQFGFIHAPANNQWALTFEGHDALNKLCG